MAECRKHEPREIFFFSAPGFVYFVETETPRKKKHIVIAGPNRRAIDTASKVVVTEREKASRKSVI
jgi:hypothetical protein